MLDYAVRNNLPTPTDCPCSFATIKVQLYKQCLTCKEECANECDECEKIVLPSLIYYLPTRNKVFMLFETDSDEGCWNTLWFTRLPTLCDGY